MINSFDGDHRFLSNFYPVRLNINGYIFPSVENAYQALKTINPNEWVRFQSMTAGQSKREGRKLILREDWEEVKIPYMKELLEIKFSIPHLQRLLLETRPHELIEGNTWGDTFWGMCNGKGENHLGKLLMELREEIQGDFPW